MRFISPLVVVLSLAPAVGKAEESGRLRPEVRGHWLRPLTEALGVCEKGSASWGWSYKTGEENILYRVNSAGERDNVEWRLPEPIQNLWYTPECRVAWVVCRDRDHLFVIDSGGDRQPLGLAQGSVGLREIWNVIPSESGKQAWLLFREEPYLTFAERGPGGISVRSIPALPPGFEPDRIERALGGDKLWATSRRDRGLYLLSPTGSKRYASLPDIEWTMMGATNLGRVLWMIPRLDKGLYAVAEDGSVLNGGAPLIPDEQVMILRGRYEQKYAWVFTKTGRIYAFRADPGPAEQMAIVPLNDGKPVAGDAGSPLQVDAMIVAAEGSRAWAMPPRRFEAYGFWKKVWHMEILPSGGIRARKVDAKLYEEKPIGTLYGSALQPHQAWVKTHDMSVYEISSRPGAQVRKVLDLGTAGLLVEWIVATDKPGRLWIQGIPHGALMGPATDLTQVSLSFAGEELRLEPSPAVLEADLSKGPKVNVTLDWPMARVGKESLSGEVAVRLMERGRNGPVVRGEGHGELVNGEAAFRLPNLAEQTATRPLDVELRYRDRYGSNMAVLWKQITFRLPWYLRLTSQPWFRGLLILVLPTFLLLLSLRRSWAVRSWVPVLVPAAGLVAAKAVPDLMSVTWLELLLLAPVLAAAMLAFGLLAPPLFRELAVLQPFQGLVPVVLKLRPVRRKVFDSYLTALEEDLRRSRQSSLGESYVAVPVRVRGGAPERLTGGKPLLNVEELCRLLMARDPGDRANLFIEAPGGRGKSALLHELLGRCIEAFRKDPLLPLPLVGDLRSASVEEAALAGLGRHGLSEDLVRAQLRNGDLAVFLDGLSESQLAPSHLEAFLQGAGGDHTRLCLATRPSTVFRHAMDKADRWLCLEPERLDEASVQEFVKEYARADATTKGETAEGAWERIQPRLERLLPICEAADGTFLPLLVRWCMIAPEQAVQSAADLYRAILEKLLTKRPEASKGDLWEEMEDLCFETYWGDRQRTFSARRSTEEQTRTVEELLQVGILIAVDDWSTKLLPRPKRVRFFHDSVQSYLTARALSRRRDWGVLLQAAGDPDFCKASSDLFDGGAELFWMCLQVFEPTWRIRQYLESDLRAWAVDLRTALSIDDVKAALSEEDSINLPENTSPGEYLQVALDWILDRDIKEDGARRLGHLYARLALIAWPKQAGAETFRRKKVA